MLPLVGRAMKVGAGPFDDPLAEPVVVAERGRANLQDVLGTSGTVPELFGPFDAEVHLLD